MKRACVTSSARRLPLIRARLSRRGFRHFRSALLAYRVDAISGGFAQGYACAVLDAGGVDLRSVVGLIRLAEGEVEGMHLPRHTHISHLDSWDHPTAPAPICASGFAPCRPRSRCSTRRIVSRTTGLAASASGKGVVAVCLI